MKLPESTATIRSAGSRSSRAMVSVRGSIVAVRPSARRRRRARRASAPRGRSARPQLRAVAGTGRAALAGQCRQRGRAPSRATSPSTPRSTGRCAPSAAGVVDPPGRPWRPAPISVPCRIVHMFSAQPQPTIRSAPRDQLGGQRRGEPAAHVEVPRAAAEQALGRGRRGQQRPARVGEPLQVGPRSAVPGAPPGDEHRPLRRAARTRRPARPPPPSRAGSGRQRRRRRVARGRIALGRPGRRAACASTTVRRSRPPRP